MNKYGISEAKSRVGFRTYAVSNSASFNRGSFRDLLLKSAVFVSAVSLVLSAFVPPANLVIAAHEDPNIEQDNGLVPDDCNTDEWHWVINQLEVGSGNDKQDIPSPTHITVHFKNGGQIDVPLEKTTGKTAHYRWDANLDDVLEAPGAEAYMDATYVDEWSGNFNLSHGPCNDDTDDEEDTVTVTIVKYLDGELATAGAADNTAFPMQSSWDDPDGIGSGSGNYTLSPVGFNNLNPYYATTSEMSVGADYSTNEVFGDIVGENCRAETPYALVGYTTGMTLEEAENESSSTSSPEFLDLQNDMYVIVWNQSCEDEPEVPPCQEGPAWAATVVASEQGKRKDGSDVIPERSDENKALGAADWVPGTGSNFYSLGFGGTITLAFSGYVVDTQGDDLSFHEGTNGSYPDERLSIEVSQNGSDWITLTDEATNTDPSHVSYADFNETGLAWIKYVRLTDISNPASFPNDADGYDLDAVDATYQLCEPPVQEQECEQFDIIDRVVSLVAVDTQKVQCSISGHKYRDSNKNSQIDSDTDELLQGWDIFLDTSSACLYNGDEPTRTTDANGYYEFNNLAAGTYYVCERQQSYWDQVLPNNGDGPGQWVNEVTLTDSSVSDVDFLNVETHKDACEEPTEEESVFAQVLAFVSDAIIVNENPYCAISGHKYEDENLNDEIDKNNEDYNDPTVAGVTIFLTTNGTCNYEDAVAETTTDINGYYEFTNLASDTYYVCELLSNGWTQVLPGEPAYHEIELAYFSHYNVDFLNRNDNPEPCEEPVTFSLISGAETETAGSTNVNPSGNPLDETSYEGSFGAAVTATTVIPPWVDPTTGSFSGSGAVWVSTSTDHPGAGDEGSSTEDQWRLFKHDFNIPDADSIEQATLYFTADNAVTVYLNDVEIASTPVSTYGVNAFPVDPNFDDTYSVNFTPIEGDNTLAFVVRNSGGEYGPSNPTALLYATSITYTPACDDGPPPPPPPGGGGGSSSSRSGGSSTTGRVLGDSTSIPYQAPQVLGETTELPRTGTPLSIAFSIFGILAIIMIPRYAKVAVK